MEAFDYQLAAHHREVDEVEQKNLEIEEMADRVTPSEVVRAFRDHIENEDIKKIAEVSEAIKLFQAAEKDFYKNFDASYYWDAWERGEDDIEALVRQRAYESAEDFVNQKR